MLTASRADGETMMNGSRLTQFKWTFAASGLAWLPARLSDMASVVWAPHNRAQSALMIMAAAALSSAASPGTSYRIAPSVRPGVMAGGDAAVGRHRLNVSLPAQAALVPPSTFQQLTPAEAFAANASLPISSLPNPPAKAFKLDGANADDRARALNCLTAAVYYEAASESLEGQAAVAQVVLNRLRHPLFPKTVCGVVFEGADLQTGCQFTFTCDGSLSRRPSLVGWRRASDVAERALDGYVMKPVGEATHYHTVWVVPYWRPTVVKLTQIGAHIFYRWAGGAGAPRAFNGRYAGAEPSPPQGLGLEDGAQLQTASNDGASQPQIIKVADVQPVALTAPDQGADAVAQTVQTQPEPAVASAPPKAPAKPSFFGSPKNAGVGAKPPW
jgi:spore germination cell wall hydrolase CwlJ-like protein